MARAKKTPPTKQATSYIHPDSPAPMRPEVGTQAQFKKKKPPQTYRYDSSLSPALDWDGQNPAREEGEKLIAEIADCGWPMGRAGDWQSRPDGNRMQPCSQN